MPMRTQPALLAVTATATAACLSVMAGWQRGGWVAERVLWIAVGVVLVVSAHLLPALCRSHGWRLRVIGAALWLACMVATCYGHAVFFVMAQKHAGELRAATVPVVVTHGRGLAEIAADRADAIARLTRVTERRCGDRCATVRIERATLSARLDALTIEADEAKRAEAAHDRMNAAHADLVAGLAFAAVLEGIACFAWLLALRPVDVPEIAVTPVTEATHGALVTSVTDSSNAVAALDSPAAEQPDDVTRVMTAIASKALRPTVTEIRRFLGCSQATAMAVRKQVTSAAEI